MLLECFKHLKLKFSIRKSVFKFLTQFNLGCNFQLNFKTSLALPNSFTEPHFKQCNAFKYKSRAIIKFNKNKILHSDKHMTHFYRKIVCFKINNLQFHHPLETQCILTSMTWWNIDTYITYLMHFSISKLLIHSSIVSIPKTLLID